MGAMSLSKMGQLLRNLRVPRVATDANGKVTGLLGPDGDIVISSGYRNIDEFKSDSDPDYTVALQHCATNGIQVEITRPGIYYINDTITWTGVTSDFRASLHIAEGCSLVATSGLAGKPMLVLTGDSASHNVGFSIHGLGELNCNNIADKGIWIKTGARGVIKDLTIKNAVLIGAQSGDGSSPSGGSDAWFMDVMVIRDGGSNNNASSIGMYFEYMTDIRAVNCDVIGYRIGFKNTSVNVDYQNCHAWSKATYGPMTHGFYVAGAGTRINMCHGDTPHNRNYDNSIDGSITDVYGFYIDAYGGVITSPRCYLEPDNSVNNVATGIYFNKSDGYFELSHDRYDTGAAGTNKFKKFIAQNGRTLLRGIRRVGGSAGALAYDSTNMDDVMPNGALVYGQQTLFNKLKIHQDNSAGQSLDLSVSKSGNGTVVNVDPLNTDNIAALLFRLFRYSTTTDANSGLLIMKGDNTATTSHALLCNGNMGVGGASSYGGGVKVIAVPNAGTVPSTNPSGGGVLYCEGGALKYRGSSGTVTTLGPA